MICLPSRLLAADYDRAFRVLPQGAAAALIERPERDPNEFPVSANAVWGLAPFDEASRNLLAWDQSTLSVIDDIEDQEAAQLAADPEAFVDLDIPSPYDEFADWETRKSARRHLETSIAYARGDWLTDHGFDSRDRPGPSPAWVEETAQLDAADVSALNGRGPGCFVLPVPSTQPTAPGATHWDDQIEAVFAAARLDRWTSVRFGGPLALDVALRGKAGRHADLDNITRKILTAFSSAFADADPVFTGYRAYRLDADFDDVRVRVMPALRLEALASAMQHARVVLHSERSERLRD
ncbi:MAG: hypothetical protein WKF96_06680 [Solirubrobacteraceae bacterium]